MLRPRHSGLPSMVLPLMEEGTRIVLYAPDAIDVFCVSHSSSLTLITNMSMNL